MKFSSDENLPGGRRWVVKGGIIKMRASGYRGYEFRAAAAEITLLRYGAQISARPVKYTPAPRGILMRDTPP